MTVSPSAALQDPKQDAKPDPRAPRRVRHEPRRRELRVKRVDKISAHMLRVALGGDLEGFTSLGFDDHIKLFFPDGSPAADGTPQVASRDYTPRRYDPAGNTLEIEFVLHDAGPATRWAEQVQPGQSLQVGGPRGSFIIPLNFDWHLLIGDDTALPAIARRLAELPAGTKAVVLAEVDGPADQVTFESAADVSVTWAYRNGAEAGTATVLADKLKTMRLPTGDYYAWVACESLTAKALRAQLIAQHGANPKWMRAAGYWRRGAVAVHDTHND
jgi:NADPH-dependent ferric siderophore reductase